MCIKYFYRYSCNVFPVCKNRTDPYTNVQRKVHRTGYKCCSASPRTFVICSIKVQSLFLAWYVHLFIL